MKFRFTLYLILIIGLLQAQNNSLQSKVYQWDINNNGSSNKVQKSTIFGGEGGVLAKHAMIGVSIPTGKKWEGKVSVKIEKFPMVLHAPENIGLTRITVKKDGETTNS